MLSQQNFSNKCIQIIYAIIFIIFFCPQSLRTNLFESVKKIYENNLLQTTFAAEIKKTKHKFATV